MVFKVNNISIRNKLVIMLVFTSVLVLGIFFVVFVYTDIKYYKLRKAEEMISLAQVIGTNTISTIEFDDTEAATNILAELHTVSPEIVSAAIVDSKGKIFAYYARPGINNFNFPRELETKNSLFNGKQLMVSNDIINDEKKLGKVYLEAELIGLQKMKRVKYEMVVLLLVVAVGVSFIIAILIQSYISKRLVSLVGTMNEVSKSGDYTKTIKDEGKDEIGSLIKVFNNLMQQVKENQKRKDEFIGVASHELKTPLTSIKGYMQLLAAMEERDPHKQYVQKGLDNVKKLEDLIKDLLDVSKIQSGQLELNIKKFNVDTLVNETIEGLQMTTPSHKIIWENKLENQLVTGDRQRIEQVLINLLSNAIKYSPGAEKIIVQTSCTNKQLTIRVRDFGIGIPEAERFTIFERFYRTKDISEHISGFGLGLYICMDIITRHHGKIWVEGEQQGSSFYFSLPVENSSAMA